MVVEEFEGLSFRQHIGTVKSDELEFDIALCLQSGNLIFNTAGKQYRARIDKIFDQVVLLHTGNITNH